MIHKGKNGGTQNSLRFKLAKLLNLENRCGSRHIALKISGAYILIGVLWILLSDSFLEAVAHDKEHITFIGMVKGLVYVVLSGGIVFSLVHASLRKVKVAQEETVKNLEKLREINHQLLVTQEFNKAIIDKMLNAFALHRIILDDQGKPCDYEFMDVNASFEVFTGLKRKDIIGKRYRELVPESEREKTDWVAIYGEVAATGEPVSLEAYTDVFEKWVVVNAYSPEKGYFITLFNDITETKRNEAKLKEKYEELKEYQEQLKRIAYYDHLTGLPNRMAFYDNLSKYLLNKPDVESAMLFIDSDNFKFINDTMGHSFGDQFIKEIGRRLSLLFEDRHTVYRLGGDEFIVCCREYPSLEYVIECAEGILHSFSFPFEIEDSTLYASVSIGIATYPKDGSNPDEIMKSADIAMYRAKSMGKNRYVFYDQSMQDAVTKRMIIEKHLRSALQNNEFLLYFQPQLDVKNGRISGFEALLRWNNADLGFVSPLTFIGIAEETHLIIPIGEWVLRNACFFLKQMHMKGYTGLKISVNVSILQLIQKNFVDTVRQILEFIDMSPQYLELEITESILMESFQTIRDKLNQLKGMGIQIALDDFGQGYSSLSYLKQIPIDTLKIDKSFIDSICSEDGSESLTGTIIAIGRRMGLTIVAEGVENQEQMGYLKKHRCHLIQGYFISKPLAPEAAVKFYEGWRQHLMDGI